MARLLAVQPDSAEVEALLEALRAYISDDVVVAESLDEALSSIDQQVPDVILLPTLIPAAVEGYLVAYLSTVPGAGHTQILGLPRLERPYAFVQRQVRSLFPWRRPLRSNVAGTRGCDPGAFTQVVLAYLASAKALKEEIELRSTHAALSERRERRREPRFGEDEVPWISFVSFGGERATLINVSSRGALFRTHSRPEHHLLRRSYSNVGERSRLTLEVDSDSKVRAMGRIIRCVPSKTSAPTQYEIAFSFDQTLGLHLPPTDTLVPAASETEDDGW